MWCDVPCQFVSNINTLKYNEVKIIECITVNWSWWSRCGYFTKDFLFVKYWTNVRFCVHIFSINRKSVSYHTIIKYFCSKCTLVNSCWQLFENLFNMRWSGSCYNYFYCIYFNNEIRCQNGWMSKIYCGFDFNEEIKTVVALKHTFLDFCTDFWALQKNFAMILTSW